MQITFEQVSYTYGIKTPYEEQALKEVSFTIPRQKLVTVLGHTGSGKTTALQLIKGLIHPTSGNVNYTEGQQSVQATSKKPNKIDKQKLHDMWTKIGYVFQYPEHQLFEETVGQDIAYGPRNLKYSETDIQEIVQNALREVELDAQRFADRSPFELSGGEMRRVAIAGILAMNPRLMILDEPMAGLDPLSKRNLLARLYTLHKQNQWTTVCVSHHIDELWQYTDLFLIFHNKQVVFQGTKERLLAEWQQGNTLIEPPMLVKLAMELIRKGKITTALSELHNVLESESKFADFLRTELTLTKE
ncbi:hypothetical protein BHU72_14135 [Desulfuribacillus stibiiarsenatis]|uniref:ABC transporter domain-containing protein n=1 Tax=Desulfuribacillus stibiiarsenatis TaxID=1390249 RepID=A0A1E5L870_9FIRM|nr:ATP-binding cassette domain-containing protein [Desulfuribacillus stibiiarsenatis]OEH86357.1 hypothetical protein BHU72_14135 [Desulfuribacillus stibiiarsenatis]